MIFFFGKFSLKFRLILRLKFNWITLGIESEGNIHINFQRNPRIKLDNLSSDQSGVKFLA